MFLVFEAVHWTFGSCFCTICDCLSLQTTKALQSQLQNLESMKVEMAVTESQLEDWLNDLKEWADSEEMTSVQTRFQKSWDTVQIVNKNRMQWCGSFTFQYFIQNTT